MLKLRTTRVESFAGTDTGLVRSANEDSFLFFFPQDQMLLEEKGILAIVADGVGGNIGGKTASSTAVSVMRERYYASDQLDPLSALKESMIAANREILTKAAQDPSCKGMATTCTAFILLGKDGFFSHAGDSRAYLLRDGILRQLTKDHTLVNKLLADGLITAEAAESHPQKNIIVRALGSDRDMAPDTFHLLLEENDIILLCSDGLHGLVSDDDIKDRLSRLSLQGAGQSLIELAKDHGGTDNITVIILQLSSMDGIAGDETKPFFPAGTEKKKHRMRFAVIGAVLAALLFGCLFYLWTEHGLKENVLPNLGDLIKINK
jgi:PPM family protein phosphatase